ncbi:MAG TPA: RNA polymerase sigma-70 factor [Cyclobacteriaceae bacterium]|nr:RNA polymerase sigma-70 factor [Cyclobacteriaceae bacterium]
MALSDPEAFGQVFRKYSNKIYIYALKLTRSKSLSEEIVQEVFIKIWVNRSSLTSIDYFPSYLYTITKNHTFNILKHISVEVKSKAQYLDKSLELQPSSVQSEHYDDLNQAVNKLPPQQQLVYKMCYHEGLRYDEVAEKLQISHLTVKTHMQQALRTIRGYFKKPVQL